MLDQARTKQRDRRVRYEVGRAEAIPLPDDSVDLIFMSMIFHHIEDPVLAARECRRVLRDGGIAFLRAGIRDRISSYPYAEFFPESRPILEDTLPSAAKIREVFESAGFTTFDTDLITQQIASDYGAYAEKIAAGADSVLARLSPNDFQAGMEALQSHAAHAGDKPVSEPIDIFVFR
jgi:ubiquinone/menaquinone biosynthesis C-methylase UbiE